MKINRRDFSSLSSRARTMTIRRGEEIHRFRDGKLVQVFLVRDIVQIKNPVNDSSCSKQEMPPARQLSSDEVKRLCPPVIGDKANAHKSGVITQATNDFSQLPGSVNLEPVNNPTFPKVVSSGLKSQGIFPQVKKEIINEKLTAEIHKNIEEYLRNLKKPIGIQKDGRFTLYVDDSLIDLDVFNLCKKKRLYPFIQDKIFTIELLLKFVNKDKFNIAHLTNFLRSPSNREILAERKNNPIKSANELSDIIVPKILCCKIL